MRRRVTIVSYHFVRDLRRSRYPRVKGLVANTFAGQLGYIRRHDQGIPMEDVIAASIDPMRTLPERALLLTFDGGYADHDRTVFPLLDRFGWQGSFFPPARPVLERHVLDTNKVHFLLAAVDDAARLVAALDAHVATNRVAFGIDTLDHAAQMRQADASMGFVRRVGCETTAWTMCYPYGGYDASVLRVLAGRGCCVGLTTELAIADLGAGSPLALARLDTNDLPTSGEAPQNGWTAAAPTGHLHNTVIDAAA